MSGENNNNKAGEKAKEALINLEEACDTKHEECRRWFLTRNKWDDYGFLTFTTLGFLYGLNCFATKYEKASDLLMSTATHTLVGMGYGACFGRFSFAILGATGLKVAMDRFLEKR